MEKCEFLPSSCALMRSFTTFVGETAHTQLWGGKTMSLLHQPLAMAVATCDIIMQPNNEKQKEKHIILFLHQLNF